MLINLKHDGLQYEWGGGDHVQRLLRLGQPVDEVLQRVVEIRGLRQRFLEFDLWDSTVENNPDAFAANLKVQEGKNKLIGCYNTG